MIRINLLPKEMQRTASAQSIVVPWKTIGFSVVGILLFYSVWLFAANQFRSRAVVKLKAEWETLRTQAAHFDQVDTSVRALQNRAVVLKGLKEPKGQWAPRLNLLSDALVSNLWFTSLKITTAGPVKLQASAPAQSSSGKGKQVKQLAAGPSTVLLLQGSALVPAGGGTGSPIVSLYLQRLKQQPDFSKWYRDVKLTSVEQRQVQEETVSDFVITLYPTG